EVAALVSLEHVFLKQSGVAARRCCTQRWRRLPLRKTALELRVFDQKLELARLDIESYPVAGLHRRERAAYGRLRRDVQDNRAKSRAAHARVGDSQHVCDTLPGQLHRNRKIACLGHSWRSLWSGVAQNKNVLWMYIEIRLVDTRSHIFDRVEYDGTAGVAQQVRRSCRVLDDGTLRREIAAQHRNRSFFLQRRGENANRLLPGNLLSIRDHFANRFA